MKKEIKKIWAKYSSRCAETGKNIKKYDWMYYDYADKKCYHVDSPTGIAQAKKEEEENERRSISAYIDAQECAMFERYGKF